MPPNELKEWQTGKLCKLLCHARDTTRFYGPLIPQRFAPSESWDMLSSLPIVTKHMIDADPDAFFSSAYSQEQSWAGATSGTTGLALAFWMDRSRRARVLAELAYFGGWGGYEIGERHMFLRPAYSSVPKSKVDLWARNQVLVDAGRLNDAKLSDIVQLLVHSRARVLFGYSWTIESLAAFLRRSGQHAFGPRSELRAIISIGGPLTGISKARVEEILGCSVYERYSASEVGTIAGECEMRRLHLNVGSVHTEFMPAETTRLPADGQPETLLVTDLCNRAMPFLRYDLRDAVRLDEGECRCGRRSPLIGAIHGRAMEQVVTPEGEWIDPVCIANLLKTITAIRHFQFTQETVSDYVVRVVPSNGFGGHTLREIAERYRRLLGPTADVEVRVVDEIPLMPSGKRQFVINKLREIEASKLRPT